MLAHGGSVEEHAMQEWLSTYHGARRGSLSSFGQSGLIQQALVFQMHSKQFNAIEVKTVGWNGQLPMLDLYYLVKRLSENGPGIKLSQVSSQLLTHFQT